MSTSNVPRGSGLFEVGRAQGERFITNVRRIAGAERAPGSALISSATVLLGLLAAGLFAVSLSAQYRYVFEVKHVAPAAAIEALALDAAMTVFSLLGLGLAMAGQSARIERALIVACALGSAGMNYAAANVTSPRSVVAYVAPPVLLAVVVDRVIAVVRRHVLDDTERSVWAVLGRAAAAALKALGLVMLYLLRLVLAPPSTSAGLRRVVLNATPLPEAQRLALPPAVTTLRVLEGETKRAACERLYVAHPDAWNRAKAPQVAGEIARAIGYSEGTARAVVNEALKAHETWRQGK